MPEKAQTISEETKPTPAPTPVPDPPEESLEELLRYAQDPISSEERRKVIEKKLEEVDISRFIFHGYVEQTIPLAVSVTFRTPYTRHTLWAERMLGELLDRNMIYVDHYGRILNLSIYIVHVGEKALPSISEYKKEEDYEAFKASIVERLEFLQDLPTEFTDDLSTNLEWFNRRVRHKLASTGVSDIKN